MAKEQILRDDELAIIECTDEDDEFLALQEKKLSSPKIPFETIKYLKSVYTQKLDYNPIRDKYEIEKIKDDWTTTPVKYFWTK
jgi:hypothetical protein